MKRIGLVLSAVAFLCLHIHQSSAAISVAVAIPFLIFFAIKMPQLGAPRPIGRAVKAFAALTAVGACLWPMEGYAGWLTSITVFQRVQSAVGVEMALLSQIAAVAFAAAGLWFTYRMVCLFYERFLAAVKDTLNDFSKAEGIAALASSLLLLAAVVVVYTQTDAFAHAVVKRDLIYTADSGAIVHENAYLSLNATENDFRSPLFALFAAPLLGLPYLLGRILPFANAQAAVLVAAQAPLLVAGFFLLMKMIRGVSKPARVLLPLAMLSTYGALLFTLTAEQYAVALFYFALCLYSLVMHGRREQLLILGAAGTMIPGAALALVPGRKKKLSAILLDALQSALWAFVLLCTFAGFGMLLQIPESLHSVSRFTGETVTFADRLSQFASFAGQIFLAPQAEGVAVDGFMKWRLIGNGGLGVLGAVILALATVGFALNRKQVFARLSALWIIISFVLLCVLGWGTAENGLTLYTLYFGWAYAALLVYLTESVMKRINLERFSWIVYALGAAGMLAYNFPRIADLLSFAMINYPI